MHARSPISPQKIKTRIVLKANEIAKFLALDTEDGCTLVTTEAIEGDVGDVLEISIPAHDTLDIGTNKDGRPIYLLTNKDIRNVTHERNVIPKKEQKVFCAWIYYLLA